MKLEEIARIVNGKLSGDPNILINRIAPIEETKEGDITWLSHPRYEQWLDKIQASCIIVPEKKRVKKIATIEVPNPSYAIITLLKKFYSSPLVKKEISREAYIEESAKIGKEVSIGAFSYIGEDTIIGDEVVIFPNSYIGNQVKIGTRSHIFPNVVILDKVNIGCNVRIYSGAVIGSDGFAYTQMEGKHIPIPHHGSVIIEDEVEVGALSTIDRALVGNTVIKKGTKIDNLVHIAHNVVVGKHSIIVAQAGIAGSVRIGDEVIIGGQAGITDHIVIGNKAKIGGQAGVTKDVENETIVCGYPARPRRVSNLAYSLLMKLPDLFRRVKILEKQCKQQ
jgi:UDP-3-O-[3-hydroxymyristoyl] glucosamine N-acyltransferase